VFGEGGAGARVLYHCSWLSGRRKGKNPRDEDIRPSQDSQAAGFVHHQLRTNGAHLLYFLRLNIFQAIKNNKVQVE
jgi:hypothetical protein